VIAVVVCVYCVHFVQLKVAQLPSLLLLDMAPSVLPLETIAPSAEDRAVVLKSSQILLSCLNSEDSHYRIEVVSGETAGQTVTIPASALRLLADVLTQMASGHAVKIVPIKQELSTSEAADLLNVSRSYFVGLLESGKIPFCTVGTRRRVLYEDVIAYKSQIDAQREKTLAELAAQAQELKMGYE
jgi:excisionase family DNA binding protein